MSALAGNRLVQALRARRGLAPYLTAGDGGLDRSVELLRACEAAGAVLVELGVPFSDPMADGPVLQAAAERALAGGTSLSGVLSALERFRAGSELPVAIFTYANPLWRLGLDEAMARISGAGADAVLVPDVPLEESEPLCDAAEARGLCPVLFAAPSTSEPRLERIAAATRGFLYAIGRFGVTGKAAELSPTLDAFLSRVRAAARTPVGVGFGLSTPGHVRHILDRAELAIVGSALVERIHRADDPVQACYDYLRSLVSDPGSSP